MLIQNSEIPTLGNVSLRIINGRIAEIGAKLSPHTGEEIFDARGSALLPGLHDHHLHLLAFASTQNSVCCGPPAVADAKTLAHVLRSSALQADAQNDSIRGFAYHESVAGELDRWQLDAIRSDVPVRIQHRTGALWILNSRAIDAIGLDRGVDHSSVERDLQGRATGRLLRGDAWLRDKFASTLDRESIARASHQLAAFGITSITDASAANRESEWNFFAELIQDSVILQNVHVMGNFDLSVVMRDLASWKNRKNSSCLLPALGCGARKILLHEGELPVLEYLVKEIRNMHLENRGVSLHCVTRTELIFAASALAQAGLHSADRIEHASIAPPDVIALLAALSSKDPAGLTETTNASPAHIAPYSALLQKESALQPPSIQIVTQPHFLFERGDQYLRDVDPQDRPWLYRGRAFLDAGLRLRAGSDAPYGSADPWFSMRCATQRETVSGVSIAANEALSPEEAFLLFMPITAGTNFDFEFCLRKMFSLGEPADFCLLDRPWSKARSTLSSDIVRATFRAGIRIDQATRD